MTRELRSLTDAVLPGRTGAPREVEEGLVRLIGFAVRLHEEHRVDARGRCVTCRRRRCPVQDALSVHITPWLYPAPAPRITGVNLTRRSAARARRAAS